jgi:hypothetical protein
MALDPIVGWTTIEQGGGSKEVVANAAMADISQVAGGVLSKSVAAGGTINLTLDESQSGVILLTGAPGSAVTIVQHASAPKRTLYQNLTTGGQTIQAKQSGGSAFTIPANSLLLLLSATDAIVFGSNATPLALATSGTPGTSEELARTDHRHPRDWVDLTFNIGPTTWTDMPAALTEFNGANDRRVKVDMTQFTEARLIVNVETVGFAGSSLYAEFATTDGGTYAALDNSTGPNALLTTAGTIVSSVVSLTAGAKADNFVRISGINGDGAADPVIGAIHLQVR